MYAAVKTLKFIGIHTGVFVIALTVLYLLLSLSCMIPNEKIQENMAESAYCYAEAEPFSRETGEKLSGIADNYADTILLNVAHYMGEGNPFTASLDTKYYSGKQEGVNVGFFRAVTENASPDTDYTRYWHGNAMLVRVMHLFTNVSVMKNIGFGTVMLLLLILLVYLIKRKNYKTAISLFAASACIHIWNIRLAMEYQSVFILGYAMCLLFLMSEKKSDKLLSKLAVIGGTLTAVFDFLTCETVVILLPLVLLISAKAEENRLPGFKETFKLIAICIICFGAAYAASFLAKWTLATVAVGENKFTAAFMVAEERTGTNLEVVETANFVQSMVYSLFANITVLFGGTVRVDFGRSLLGIFVAVGALGSVLYLFRKKEFNKTAFWSMLILGSLVALRFVFLSNHSYLHEFFTYRALITPIAGIFATVLLNIELPVKKAVKRK